MSPSSRASRYLTDAAQAATEQQQRLKAALPTWECWSATSWGGRRTWSARPEGAPFAVIMDEDSPASLIVSVREYEAELPRHIDETKARIAELPDTGVGHGQAKVLGALLTALEELIRRKTTKES